MQSYYRSSAGSFHEFLEELPEGRRFLAAANPPRGACAADVRALSEKSYLLRYSDIRGMSHYAQLACCLAGALRWRDSDHQDARGEAWIQQATVLRILGRFPEAKEVFAKAEDELSKGSGNPLIQALLWEKRAALHRDTGEFPFAENCLEKAAGHYFRADQLPGYDECLISRAICAGYGGNPRRAVRLAEKALKRIDAKDQPVLAIAAIIALSWNLADCGLPALARACYLEGESQFDSQKDELIQAHRLWLRAHIDDALHLHQSAEIIYQRAAQIFSNQGLSFNRSLVLLDLCSPLAAQKRHKELATVAAEILPEFEQLGLRREAVRTRQYLLTAV